MDLDGSLRSPTRSASPDPTAARRLDSFALTAMLAERHKEDVFVPQCKDGASYGQGLLILDGWAMKKSWANPCVTGYEIKVSRSDFQRDDKWRGYLAYCNEFYFVCPSGMLKPEEIPEPAGLLCASKTGGVLFRKKKAARRDPQIPLSIYQYILMTRTKITREIQPGGKREFWAKWLEDQKVDREFGWAVRGKIRKAVSESIEKVEKENKDLAEKMKRYDGLRATLTALGVDADRYWTSPLDVERAVEKIRAVIPPDLKAAINSLSHHIGEFEKQLSGIEAATRPAASAEQDPK